MKRLLPVLIFFLFVQNAYSLVKIRDISNVEGLRDNQLLGYGLVVGLNGTGDKSGTAFTTQSLVNMMERMGVSVSKDEIKIKNVAAVMVTAKLPPFGRSGSKMDVVVSSVGDSKSLEGGTLLMTPLSAANGMVYAVAQGPISVGGMNVAESGAKTVKNHPTVGMIPNGAIIEQEVQYQLNQKNIVLNFKDNNLSNLVKAESAINGMLGVKAANITSPSTMVINVPEGEQQNFYNFMDKVLNTEIEPSNLARIVIDERTGTIVMGADVRVNTVAVSHGNLTITVKSTVELGKEKDAADGKAVKTEVGVNEDQGQLMVIPEALKVSDLVKALNSIGVTPRDMISILQAIKSAGALHGELSLM
ncbi:flagellar basal body P-ring protein FlgI [Seleniivibrio woodruffii]|uniref:flagellar basal body P-ring protein FlgI n=1 Tax=Seleniivibrio woodruffii TaxID=1078050 RepID=UPI0026F04BA7|nr:flagellar basal body P-ring protein FlgI [Seleniivibrio woodruffii]